MINRVIYRLFVAYPATSSGILPAKTGTSHTAPDAVHPITTSSPTTHSDTKGSLIDDRGSSLGSTQLGGIRAIVPSRNATMMLRMDNT